MLYSNETIKNTFIINFRECVKGERISENLCEKCNSGSFSLFN